MMRNLHILGLLLVFAGCKEDTNLLQPSCEFDHKAMFTNYADSLIIPAYSRLASTTQQLHAKAQNFVAAPAVAPLQELKAAFNSAYQAYQAASPYYFGPAKEAAILLNERLNTFPSNIAAVETAVSQGNTPIDDLFKTTVGLPAIEYLLYGNFADASSEADIVNQFLGQPKRKDFLLALTADASSKTAAVLAQWNSTYRNTFIANEGTADGSSLSLMVNELNFDYETVKNYKFKRPLGKFDGGIIQPQKAEGYHSGTGLELAKLHLAEVIRAFNGGSGIGLDDYCACLDKGINPTRLDVAINNQFKVVSDQLGQLQGTLTENLNTHQQEVDNLLNEMQKLVPLLKRDMTAEMGVRINYLDNDGD